MKPRLVDRAWSGPWRPEHELLLGLERICAPAGRSDWPVDVVLMEDSRMQELNQHFRMQAQVTDVLSFSYLEEEGQGPPLLVAGRGYARRDLWWNEMEAEAGSAVGEVILAPDYVAAQCQSQGWSFADEIALLTVHGVLHILGWDHGDQAAAAAMREAEVALLACGGVTHPIPLREGTD